MMHHNRRFRVAPVRDLNELVRKLTEHDWTTCSAFSWSSLTLANDSTSADGAQEYAVFRNGRQIESLTVSWMNADKLRVMLERLDTGSDGNEFYMTGPALRTDHPEDYCSRCA